MHKKLRFADPVFITSGIHTYDHCDTNAVLYQLNKFSTENPFIYTLFADCMEGLLRSKAFYPSRHIMVLSEHDDIADLR